MNENSTIAWNNTTKKNEYKASSLDPTQAHLWSHYNWYNSAQLDLRLGTQWGAQHIPPDHVDPKAQPPCQEMTRKTHNQNNQVNNGKQDSTTRATTNTREHPLLEEEKQQGQNNKYTWLLKRGVSSHRLLWVTQA